MNTLKIIGPWFATVALVGWLGQSTVLGQGSPATGAQMMGHGMMGTNMPSEMMGKNAPSGMRNQEMMNSHQEMMAEHQKIMSEMNNLDAGLKLKVAQMNQAQGSAKLDAMTAVINDLVKERQLAREQMKLMQQSMRAHMQGMAGMGHAATNSPTGR